MAQGPIIRSPMRPAKKGEAPSVEWARWVENTLRRLIDEPAKRNRPITGGGSSEKPPFWTAISTVPESDPVEYQVTVTPGYLTYQNAGASESELGVVGYISPKIDDGEGNKVSMEEAEVPAVPLPVAASYVYLRVKTDADGVPKFEDDSVTIEAFDEAQDSIHHVRPSPSGGEEEGDYFFLILETESDGGTPAKPTVVRRITGNRSIPNQLVEIANVGGKRELYQGYLPGPDDKHEFRSLEQMEDGEDHEAPVMVPLEEGEDEGDTLKFVGLGVKSVSPQRPANFELGEDNKVSLLNFTGIDGPIAIGPAGGVLQFAGGLCTGGSGNGENPPELTGKNLDLEIEYLQYNNAGEVYGTPYTYVTLFWRNGLYVGTENPNDAPENLIQVKATWLVNAA